MKKKIFFIMSTDDYSGAEAVNFSIIDGLKDKYDFYWVSKKGNINSYLDEKNIKWIEISKLSVKEIRRIVKEYHPDILHATDYRASFICSLANTKVLLIEHLHNNSPWLKKFSINSFIFLFSGLMADNILTVSDSIEKEFIFSSLLHKKIHCVGNPISRNAVVSRIGSNDYKKKYDVCCVARITEQKNPFKFIDIIEKLKLEFNNISVIWIGKGDLEEECKMLVKEKGLENNIDFVGFKKNPYTLMARSKIFLLTSSWEGYGLVAFEALCLGLPCCVSEVGGLPKIVDDKCGFLSNDVNSMVNFISKLMKDNRLYNEFSSNAIEHSEKLDNLGKYLQLIESFYK